MLTWRWFTLGFVVCLAAWGCEAPTAIVSSAPPGTNLPRTLPESEKKAPPEALGEQPASNASSSSKKKSAAASKVDPSAPTAPPTAKGETKTTPSGVKYETLKEGTGAEAKPGQRVSVHYTGTLENGTKFDSSRDEGKQPFSFTIGAEPAEVIKGWDEGVPGMKVGERRKLTVPPSAGYGAQDQGVIPPNSTLIFDVELLGVE